MRKLMLMEHMSLDGVIQIKAPGEDNDFPYGEWTGAYRTPEGRDALLARLGAPFDLLLGRHTYDLWSGSWPKAPSSPMADAINGATKYIVTHRAESLSWGPFEAVAPDTVEGIRRIKSQPGRHIILWGSSTITSTVLEHGLADEIVLLIYPVLLGKGKRIFADGTPPRSFELVGTTTTPTGIIVASYKFNGPLKNFENSQYK